MTTTPTSTKIAYATAIGLACFSGAVATYGLTKFAPGAELVVAAMGVLFEAGKLTSFAIIHRPLPRLLKTALLTIGLCLMALNVAGVSGFLSAAYERQQISAKATAHTAESTAYASASLIERQLAAAESNLAQARQALVRARDDKGRIKAAQAIVTAATAERDALVAKLSAAQASSAKVEGDAIISSAEFAAVAFVAEATGASADVVAHALILAIASLPDVLAVLLLVAAGYAAPKAFDKRSGPAIRKPARKAARRPRRGLNPALKVVRNAATA
jgi:hypothetical protein